MVIRCCVPNCSSKYNRADNVRFHKFPKERNAFRLWCVKLRLCADVVTTKIHYVCSKHFLPTDYVDSFGGLRPILRLDMIPSQNLPQRSHATTIYPKVHLKRTVKLRNSNNSKDVPRTSDTFEPDFQHNSDEPADELNIIHPDPESETEPSVPSANTTLKQTVSLMRRQESIYFAALSDCDLMYYTGLNAERFLFLFDLISIKSTPYDKYMSRKDQLTLTLMKYRQNFQFQLIGKLYGVSRLIVREIFLYFTRCLYDHFQNVDFWALRYENPKAYTAIIHSSEIVTNSSTDPEQSGTIYSQHRHTLKYLIAIDEKGTVIYCSDVFDGSMSGNEMVVESGLLEKLKWGDILLSDREFDISDVLTEHGVTLKMSTFLRANIAQTPIAVKESRSIAHNKIHFERVIGLAKQNKVLSGTFPAPLRLHANKIIYIANMINNYKPPIV